LCGTYLDSLKDPDATKYTNQKVALSWGQGFLIGANAEYAASGGPQILPPDSRSIQANLEKYCHDNPQATIFEGASRFAAWLWNKGSKQ
jgi:hypothetical protein